MAHRARTTVQTRRIALAYLQRDDVNHTSASDAQDLFEQGLELLAANQAEKAVCAFRTAISFDPAHYEAHHGLVRALRESGQLEQAVGAALALTALTPSDPLAHTALSIALQQAGHIQEAEAAAARARIQEWRVQLQTPPQQESGE